MDVSLESLYQQVSIFKKSDGATKDNSHVPRFQVMTAHNVHPTDNPKHIQDVQIQKFYKIISIFF